MFQLIHPTTVKLAHINVRTEKHGPNDVDACDLDLVIEGDNSKVLALLHPDLCASLYFDSDGDDGQGVVEGIPPTLPNLRFAKMASKVTWETEATGVDLTVIYGLGDEKSNIKLEGGKANSKSFEVFEGGSAKVSFKFSIAGYADGVIDKLRKKLKQDISITLIRPEKLRSDAVIDGTVGHPGAAKDERQGDLLTPEDALAGTVAGEGTGGPDDDVPLDGDDDGSGHPDGDSGAAEQAELEAGMRDSIAKAGVKPRGRKTAGVH